MSLQGKIALVTGASRGLGEGAARALASKGARVKYAGGQSTVSRGPFSLTGDLVCGFWLIETKSLDEAIDWMKRAPFDGGSEIEIRQVFAAEDFGEALTPELRERGERLRAQVGRK